MKELIKIKNKECFIDSEGLADLAEIERRSITRLIKNHYPDLEEFGVMGFEITKPTEQGGRPKTLYTLNEQQATLLTTFMRNSPKVKDFKKKLVREFFTMRQYILSQETIRLAGKEIRKSLTDAVKDSGEQDRMHGHAYSTYTNFAYSLTGLKEKKKEYGTREGFREYLSPEELKRVKIVEGMIKPLLEMEKTYQEIKEIMVPLFEKKEIS